MKKLKKSMKIIISLACVLLVSVAAVVTVILVTKRKDKDSTVDPAPAIYALTDAQKKLVNEINTKNSTLVSSAKLSVSKINSDLKDNNGDLIEISSSFNFLSDSIIWKKTTDWNINIQYNIYTIYVLGSENGNVEFLDYLVSKEIITEEQKTNSSQVSPQINGVYIIDVIENHIMFGIKIDEQNSDVYLCSVIDHDVVIEYKNRFSSENTDEAVDQSIDFGKNFYTILKKIDGKLFYKFYYYGSNVEKLSLEVTDDESTYEIVNNAFKKDDSVVVASFSEEDGLQFASNDSSVRTLSFKKGNIIETATETTSDNQKAILSGEKYYVYSYKFVAADGTETAIDIGEYSKLSSVYSGENYFGLFFQKTDENHSLQTSGMIVYLDYELNEILKYSAESSGTTIFYSDGIYVLTKEGYFGGKNAVEHTKIKSLTEQGSNLSFSRYFSNGSFLLEDNGAYYLYNNKNERVIDLDFDGVVYMIDDLNIIMERMGDYFKVNLSDFSYSKIGYQKISGLDSRSPIYLVEEDGTKTLYNGSNVFLTNVESVSANFLDDLITINYTKPEDVNPEKSERYFLSSGSGSGITSYSSVSLTNTAAVDDETDEIELYSVTSDGFTFELNADGMYTITYVDLSAIFKKTSLTFPSTYRSIDVTAIGNGSSLDAIMWRSDNKIKEITIPGSVTTIGYQAFKNFSYLTEVYFEGTYSQMKNLSIDSGNDYLAKATWHYKNEESTTNQPEIYDYSDKINVDYIHYTSSSSSYVDTAYFEVSHCIQGGFYSGYTYFDFFEIGYTTQNQGGLTSYKPLRIYYYVTIEDQKPELHILSKGHHSIVFRKVDNPNNSSDLIYKDNDSNYYYFGPATSNDNYATLDTATSTSYDTKEISISIFSWQTTYSYESFFNEYNFREEDCSVEVYGDSIRVNFKFSLKSSSSSANTEIFHNDGSCLCKFGFTKLDGDYYYDSNGKSYYARGGTLEVNHSTNDDLYNTVKDKDYKEYYNELYYKIIMVGIYNNTQNYQDILNDNSSKNILADNVLRYINGETVEGFSKGDYVSQENGNAYLIKSGNYSYYYAYVNEKATLNTDSTIYFGQNLSEKIVGAKIAGITSLNNVSYYQNTSLYSGGSFIDEMIEFRCDEEDSTKEENSTKEEDSTKRDRNLPSQVLTKNESTGMYTMKIDNTSAIYYSGGLNYYRYVYCVYEPMKYNLELDYNISESDDSIKNEIDYLQNYAGLTIGSDDSQDYKAFNNTWAYEKTKDELSSSTIETGKYKPKDFYNNSNRLSSSETSNNEYQTPIQMQNTNVGVYYYIVVEGTKYYLQKQNVVDINESITEKYHKDRSEKGKYKYLYAKKKSSFDTVDNNADNNIVEYVSTDSGVSEDIRKACYNASEYSDKCDSFIVKLSENDGVYYANYHKVTNHTRTSTYTGRTYTGNTPDLEENKNYSVKETFSFIFSDSIVLTTIPTHVHYNFMGWQVVGGDMDGEKILIPKENDIDYGTNSDGSLKTYSIEINPYVLEEVKKYLAGSNDEGSTIKLKAIWEAKPCYIDLVFVTVENVSGNYKYEGLSYDNEAAEKLKNKIAEINNNEGLTEEEKAEYINKLYLNSEYSIISGKKAEINTTQYAPTGAGNASAPTFWKLDNPELETSSTSTIISEYKNDEACTYNVRVEFNYDPNITLEEIYKILAENNNLNSTYIATTNTGGRTFNGWAVSNINQKGEEPEYLPINPEKFPQAKTMTVAEYIKETDFISVYAYFSESLYKIGVNIYPMGGATQEITNKNYSSTDSDNETNKYKNSDIYNDSIDFAKILLTITIDTEESSTDTNKNYANYEYETYERLGISSGNYYYSKRFDESFYVGNTITFHIKETNEKYYLSQVVFKNIVLYAPNGKLEEYTLTFYRKEESTNSIWYCDAIAKNSSSNNYSGVNVGNNKSFIFGEDDSDNNNNLKCNVITFNDESGTITIKNLSNPGSLNYSSQILASNGVGFTMELSFEAYVLENEKMIVDFEDEDDKTKTFDYNRVMMTSCQPLTNKEGKKLETNGTEQAFVWFWSSKYLFKNNWENSAASGYYKIYRSTTVPADYIENFTYEDFISQNISKNGNLIVYYDNATKMIYYPAQNLDSKDIDEINEESKLTETLYYSNTSYSVIYQSYYEDITKTLFVKLDGNTYYFGEALFFNSRNNICLSNYSSNTYILYKDSLPEGSTTPILAPNGKKISDVPYSEGCSYFYAKVGMKSFKTPMLLKSGRYYYVYSYYLEITYQTENINTKGVYTPAGNTRVIAIDPEQSRSYVSDKYNTDFGNDYFYELEYYLSSVSIGSHNFSFDKLTADYQISNDSYYVYNYFKMNCRDASAYSSDGRTIYYMGSKYIINDAYKLDFTKDSTDYGSDTYYLFLTRNSEGDDYDNFVRYFLIYDIDPSYYSNSKTNTKASFEITFKFSKLEHELQVNVTEEDIYDAGTLEYGKNNNDRDGGGISFNLSYKYPTTYDDNGLEQLVDKSENYIFNRSEKFDNIYNNPDAVITPYTFYENTDGNLFSVLTGNDIANVKTLSWSSSLKFYPSSATKFNFSTKDGYIIKSIEIYVGNNKFISFEIDQNFSFDDLYYNSDGNYSYVTGTATNVGAKIKYKISTENENNSSNSLGLYINDQRGLKFNSDANQQWSFKVENTYTLDQIFVLLSGIYTDVTIDFVTTSYSEFIFEKSDDSSDNPLLKDTIDAIDREDEGSSYNESINLVDDTFINLFLKDKDYNSKAISELNPYNTNNNYKYILRYYVNASSNYIKKGTIRLIFYGTASCLKYGFDLVATNEDHSVYFTTARYYNEKNTETSANKEKDAFSNLTDYAGRTFDDNIILEVDDEGNAIDYSNAQARKKSNKLVYLSYGNSLITNYFKSYQVDFEANNKYIFATIACENIIDIDTSSYLYNNNLTTSLDEAERGEITTGSSEEYSTETNKLKYKFYNGTDYSRLYIGDGSNSNAGDFSIYQLDNKQKQQSWFNDTVLTNLDFSYYDDGYATWVKRDSSDSSISALTSISMHGLNFNWKYYETLGYYLQYIMIEIADLKTYYIINAYNYHLVEENNIEITSPGGVKFTFKLKFEYLGDESGKYGCYTLSPVYEINADTSANDLFSYVALMSNNIRVSFVSMAETYNISYKNYAYGSEISTKDNIRYYETFSNNKDERNFPTELRQTIFYDSMTTLNYSLVMDGYTFIGWGNESYLTSEGGYTSRYSAATSSDIASTWNTSSVWYDATQYYFPQGTNASDDAITLRKILSEYSGESPLPGGAFYVDGGYFLTDTGYKNNGNYTQNYNFMCDYVSIFCYKFGDEEFKNTTPTINLYGLFIANTYLIQFDINSDDNGQFYLDYASNGSFDSEFGNNNTAFIFKNGEVTTSISFYVTFDTNNWYFSGGTHSLMYSYKSEDGKPYKTGSVVDSENISTVVTDKFGYSWLGWWYKSYSDINEETTIDNTKKGQVVFGSTYLKNKYSYSQTELIKFNSTFYNTLSENDSISDSSFIKQDFVYKNQHISKPSLGTSGYIYFYSYSQSEIGNIGNNSFEFYDGLTIKYTAVSDFLNTFSTTNSDTSVYYEKEYNNPYVLSYYDTCFGANCYNLAKTGEKYVLTLDKTNLENIRIIILHANWVNNKYTLIFDSLDPNSSVENTGSGEADFKFVNEEESFFFNDEKMQYYLLGETHELPSRVGYDFVGWSFSYIKTDGKYATGDFAAQNLVATINTASSKLYLCSDLLNLYSSLIGIEGTSNLESSILMINANRLDGALDNGDWILNATDNATGNAEHLGDGETGTRYVYVFPVWRVQSFSATISLNISKSELQNLFEKDSGFALGLYTSSEYKDYYGISSKNYTFNSEYQSTMSNYSHYPQYYNDIVANICFEIDFDQRFDEAKLTIGNNTYKLADLFATSAGYYFLGLMYENEKKTDGSNYIVLNTLESVLKLNDGLTHDNASGTITYKKDKFDYDVYQELRRTDYVSGNPSAKDNYKYLKNLNARKETGKNSVKASTSFGYLSTNVYNYNCTRTNYQQLYIMSELSGGNYYLYILHNNIKYYVVYYLLNNNVNCITFDRTFLYYNEIKNGETVAKYIIRFDSSGNAYYVDDSFNKAHQITLEIALYTYATNTLYYTAKDGVIEYTIKDTSGTILKSTGANKYELVLKSFASEGANVVLTNTTTREFTLYASWEMRKIETKVINGNNSGSQSDINPGLAGYYGIKVGSNDETSTSNQEDINITSGEIDFYSNIQYNFLPFYNGRYLSDMTFEFDTFEERVNNGSTQFVMVHNTIVLRFAWNSSTRTISISNITINGTESPLKTYITTEENGEKTYFDNTFNLLLLSVLDKYNMSTTTSSLKLYNYQATEISNRVDYNKVSLYLENLMCDLNITCKFSVQTFRVEVYNVVVDNKEFTKKGESDEYITNFTSLQVMQENSNYVSTNQSAYQIPYISNVNYNDTTMSTISTDCAYKKDSYDVPYYYFIRYYNESPETSILIPTGNYGLTYLYNNGYYKNGSSDYSSISQFTNSLEQIHNKMGEGYNNDSSDWYTYYGMSGNSVVLKQYDYIVPIRNNVTIYGMFQNNNTEAKVYFYYWEGDEENGRYVQYSDIMYEYTSGHIGSKLELKEVNGRNFYTITSLPSSNYSPWQTNKNFIGFVYLNSSILGEFASSGINEKYNSTEMKTSNVYNQTTQDAYSAFAFELSKANPGIESDVSKLDINYSSALEYYYQKYVQSLTVVNLFNNQLNVVDNKFYTKKSAVQVDGLYTSILDAVRVNIGITINNGEVFYVEKDLKMLNVETEIPTSGVVYAIPIYADMNFEFLSANVDETTLNLTTNDEMLTSNLFKINPYYTLFYDPKEIRIIVTDSLIDYNNLSRNQIFEKINYYNTRNTFNKFTTIKRGENSDGTENNYGLFSYKVSVSNKYYYIYYYYVDSKGIPIYYANNYLKVRKNSSGKLEVSLSDKGTLSSSQLVEVESYVSPLEFKLEGDYLTYYNECKDVISELEITKDEKTNRKLLIYIALQLMQSGYVNIIDNSNVDNYFYGSGSSYTNSPKDEGSSYYSITDVISIINSNYRLGRDEKIVTSQIGFYRMVYSLAYYFTNNRNINDANSSELNALKALYENANVGNLFTKIDTTFGNSSVPAPGDLMKDDRSSEKTAIYNYVTGEVIYVYGVEENVKFVMLLSSSVSGNTYRFQYIDVLEDGTGYSLVTKNIEYIYSGVSEYQNNDKYERFILATGDLSALPSEYNSYYGYNFQEAYIVTYNQTYTLSLVGENNSPISHEFNNTNYIRFKEVDKTESTILIQLFGKYYLSSDVDSAATTVKSSLLETAREKANNIQSNDYSFTTTNYPYTKAQINAGVTRGSQGKNTNNYNYSFTTAIVNFLKTNYNYDSIYTTKYNANYSTYYNREITAYYNERYLQVYNSVSGKTGSYYSSYLTWFNQKYGDSSVYNYILDNKSAYDFSNFKDDFISNNLLNGIKYYFDRNGDGTVDTNVEKFDEIKESIEGTLSNDEVYMYIYNNSSNYSELITTINNSMFDYLPESLKINYYKEHYATYFDNARVNMKVIEYAKEQATTYENSTTVTTAATKIAKDMVSNDAYVEASNNYLNARASNTDYKNAFITQYIKDNCSNALKTELESGKYSTYSLVTVSDDNYSYKSIVMSNGTVICRVYKYEKDRWYFKLTPSANYSTYNKVESTENSGYDNGNVWIYAYDDNDEVVNIFTRFGSFFA